MQSYENPECTQIRLKFVLTASILHIQSVTLTIHNTIQLKLYQCTLLPWVQFYKVNPVNKLANAGKGNHIP